MNNILVLCSLILDLVYQSRYMLLSWPVTLEFSISASTAFSSDSTGLKQLLLLNHEYALARSAYIESSSLLCWAVNTHFQYIAYRMDEEVFLALECQWALKSILECLALISYAWLWMAGSSSDLLHIYDDGSLLDFTMHTGKHCCLPKATSTISVL